MFDEEHSDEEERWVSIGVAENGMTLVVIHTFTPTTPGSALIRIISARRASACNTRKANQPAAGSG